MINRKQLSLIIALAFLAGFLGGLVSGGVPVFAGKTNEIMEVVSAKKFRLIDGEGKERALLYSGEQYDSALVLRDKNGRERAKIYIYLERPLLELIDENGIARGSFGLGRYNDPTLSLVDKEGKPAARISQLTDDKTIFEVFDRGHLKARLGLLAGGNGVPTLSLFDEGDEKASFYVFRGSPAISLMDRGNKVRANFSLDSKEMGNLRFLGKDGEVIWSAP